VLKSKTKMRTFS